MTYSARYDVHCTKLDPSIGALAIAERLEGNYVWLMPRSDILIGDRVDEVKFEKALVRELDIIRDFDLAKTILWSR
ncbi:hypothetical protein [Falsiphaeobacter marinintestinus]|uniref:hypothetical protein n=1 Tax=Falsiphaeobacter marinintestinus TaxID=1492905 RepID=UPI0011B6B75F|nr:hypothetical protein [Phaeobacter marinintestinus]